MNIFVYCRYTSANLGLDYILKNFCGTIFNVYDFPANSLIGEQSIVYLAGDVAKILEHVQITGNIRVIEELSTNYDLSSVTEISLGEVPINIFNVGVYFRKLFSGKDYYNAINSEHEFQALQLSDKPGVAFRKGIYLTHVEESGDEIKFKLLRCSTNLNGPTDNFRTTDLEVVNKVNSLSKEFYKGADLNHVLAQTYHNSEVNGKQKKATIAEHSDKTKDMPADGLMAFCTFYKDYCDEFTDPTAKYDKDDFDYTYGKGASVLTRLRFRLKAEVTDPDLEKQFDITLYPNSVFLMPLSTNRLYTHEIIASTLNSDKIPTRMGYVIRCSNTEAVWKDGQTYIVEDNKYIPLVEATHDAVVELKKKYYLENFTTEVVDYAHTYFSMNNGDYLKPIV